MAKKEFSFRGKSLDELKQLSVKQLSLLLPARQRRALQRGLTEQQKILMKNLEKSNTVKTHCRDLVVLPQMVDKTIRVHNGKEFVAVQIIPEMIGHYLGELVMTRKRVGHHAPGVGATRSSTRVGAKK
ncbi:30S ribosomal protein S19 [Candidatus Woesearchaeota archaeon]|nr:30S ribosomal protein S19 [Candidatus Woesearchaeota archaeon]